MKNITAAAVVLMLSAVPVAAAAFERWLVPVNPSTVYCGYESKYETTLVLRNGTGAVMAPQCFGFGCAPLLAGEGSAIRGPEVTVPLPSYLYLPAETSGSISGRLLIESSHRGGDDRFFTEIPLVRESDFSSTVELLGVRTDETYRQTLRIYGRDIDAGKSVRVSIFDFHSGELLMEPTHVLYVHPVAGTADRSSAPSFTMECDLTAVSRKLRGRTLRLVITPLDEDAKLWAFASITSNATQHFYTVLPQ